MERSTGVVPVSLHLGPMSSVGFSRLPQPSHWSPRASYKDGNNGNSILVDKVWHTWASRQFSA